MPSAVAPRSGCGSDISAAGAALMSATIRIRCGDSSAAPAIESDLKSIDAVDPFSRLDLVNLFLPAMPVVRDVFRDWRLDRES